MPLYDYRCTSCGETCNDIYQPLSASNFRRCGVCSGTMRRILCVNLGRADLPTHHNVTVGQVVHNRREFRDALARKSDAVSERLGIAHDFQEVDRRDTETLGVTGEGLDSTARVHRARGRKITMPD